MIDDVEKAEDSDVSIADLRAFVAACDDGTFTAAARRLGLTQPGLSRQIQKLEQRLHAVLFDRSARRPVLTPAGADFLVNARTLLSSFDTAVLDLRSRPHLLEGELRIAASSTPGDYLVPAWVEAFVAANPSVRPRVDISDTQRVLLEVKESGSDVGFVGADPTASGLRYYAVAEDEVVLIVPNDHPFAVRGEVPLAELEEERFIVREGGSATLATVLQGLRQRGLSLPPHQTVMSLNTNQASLRAVQQRLGVCWGSLRCIEGDGRPGLAAVRIQEVRFLRSLYLVHRPRGLPPVATAFVRWLLEEHLPSQGRRQNQLSS